MLSIKYRDNRGSEMIQPDVESTSWHEGVLTARLAGDQSVTFGPNTYIDDQPGGPIPVAFVMNETGQTIARYDFFADSLQSALCADPELVEAAKQAA